MGITSPARVFPPFRLDPANQCLWRDNSRISLAPKAFAVLDYLVAHAGTVVSQEELLTAVWPETFVQPEVLRKYILEIRRVLDDPPKNPQFIETLPRRGYRFIAAIQSDPLQSTGYAGVEPGRKLVGREGALAELEQCLRRAVSGQRQILFVTGEAGIGKTSLVDSFQERRKSDSTIQWARGQCVEGFGGKEAYYPVLEALGWLLRAPGGASIVETLRAHAPTWLIQFPFMVKPEQRAALLQQILGATRERMVRELCEALGVLTSANPIVLILEDLQWVDDSTLDLISALARRRGGAKFLLLATYRPVEVILSRSPLKMLKQDLLIHRLCQEISLERLTEQEVGNYLATEFPQNKFTPELSALIHRHSDGNPLFMVALLQRLEQQGRISRTEDGWVLGVSPEQLDPGVPETLQQMLEVQLEQLGPEDRLLLRAASIAGQRFSAWAAGAMMESAAGPIEEACENLAAGQQFIRRVGIQEQPDGSASAQYEFKHALYREVLYRQLPPVQRARFHLRLAEQMEALATPPDRALASELASHFEMGRDYARSIRYLIVTALNAAGRYAHRDSVQILHHALGLLTHLPAEPGRALEIEVLERISDVLYAQGEMEQSAEIDYRVADLAAQGGFKTAHVNALTRVARALAFLDPDRCVMVCDRATEVSRTHDDALLQARAEMLMACWHIVARGWNERDSALCAAARERIASLSDEVPAYYEILYAHVQCVQGEYTGACHTASAGIPRSLESENLVVYFSAHSSLAHALLHLGRWGELLRTVMRAMEVAQKNGNAPWLGLLRAALAWLRYHAFDFEGARREADKLLNSHKEEPAGQVQTIARITRAFAGLALGDPDQALEAFRKVCERPLQPRFFFDWYWRLVARFGLARAWLAKGDLSKASEHAALLLEAVLAGADPAATAFAYEVQAGVAIAEKNWRKALESVEAGVAAIGAQVIPFASWRLHATASELHRSMANHDEAERQRKLAAGSVMQLADSLPEAEPLRVSLLHAAAVRRILQS
ncbi:MAG: hypothetical protein C5B51_10895 [Terriglobia bacterium]|nr:MAG: hypothetical protein C5B51_10895 [Terriglobia bacterium]